MIGRHGSEIVRTVAWLLTPFILVFGIYIVAHGHYGPGGGFAGGVVIAVGVVLIWITASEQERSRELPSRSLGPALMSVGMGIFIAAGLLPLLTGGQFLDYGHVTIGDLAPSRVRYLGILVVEIAIGLAVVGALLWIFETIAEGSET